MYACVCDTIIIIQKWTSYCTTPPPLPHTHIQALVHNPATIRPYTHIILDEIHERSTDADFALLVVRKLAVEVSRFKVILMSATMQGDLFVSYFEQTLSVAEVASPYFVGSKRYDIDTYFIDELDSLAEKRSNHWHASQIKAAATLKALVRAMPREDLRAAMNAKASVTKQAMTVCTEVVVSQGELGESILVFLPGIAEIGFYQDSLLEELELRGIADSFSIFILHSQVPFEDQKGVFNTPPRNKVHVILATNIAESSITLPKLRLVINFGVYRHLHYDSKRKLSCLVKSWCSHSSCAQRVGRAGRVFEGVAVHLFTRRFYNIILPEFNPPDMCTAPLAKLVLQAKQIGTKLGVPSPTELLMLALEPPSLEQMESALQDLADLGAVISEPGEEVTQTAEITLLGNFSLSLPVDIVLCRLVLYGIFLGIPSDAIVLAAEMSLTQDVFSLPSRYLIKHDGQYYSSLLRSIETRIGYDGGQFSEGLIVCRMFQDWIEYRNENTSGEKPLNKQALLRNFCRNRAVRTTRLLQLEATVAQIASRVLCLVPEGSQIHQDVSSLTMITRYSGMKRKSSSQTSAGKGEFDFSKGIQVHFCENPLLLKSLLTASFSHQMVVGVREVDSHFSNVKKNAQIELAYMEETRTDPAASIVMRNLDHKNPSAARSALYELLSRLLPGVPCDVSIFSDTIYIYLTPQPHPSHPPYKTIPPGSTGSGPYKSEAWEMFDREMSVVSRKLSRELYIIWQFGERKAVWTVEGIRASFSRPHHPMSLSWQNLSNKKEQVFITSFRNPSAFVCNFSSCSRPFLAVPALMQGSERKCFIFARKLTILPSLENCAAALLLAIAFQPLNSNFELLVDGMENKVVGLKINCQEIVFGEYQSITVEDIVRINALRTSISVALSSHTSPLGTLSMDKMVNIRPLLDCVLNRTPIQEPTALMSPQTVTVTPNFCLPRWEKQSVPHSDEDSDGDDSEFEMDGTDEEELKQTVPNGNISLDNFSFYPGLSCSLLKSVSFKETVVEQLLGYKKRFSDEDSVMEGPTSDNSKRSTQLHDELEKSNSNAFKLSPLAKPFIPFSSSKALSSSHKCVLESVEGVGHLRDSKDDHKLGIVGKVPSSTCVASPVVKQDFYGNTYNGIKVNLGEDVCNNNLVPDTRSTEESPILTSKKSAAAAASAVQPPPTLSPTDSTSHLANSVSSTQGQSSLQPRKFGLPHYQFLPSTNLVSPTSCSNDEMSNLQLALAGSGRNVSPPMHYSQEHADAFSRQFSQKLYEQTYAMLMLRWRQQVLAAGSYANMTCYSGQKSQARVEYKVNPATEDDTKCASSKDRGDYSCSRGTTNTPVSAVVTTSPPTTSVQPNQDVSQLPSSKEVLKSQDSLKDLEHFDTQDLPSEMTHLCDVLPSDPPSGLKADMSRKSFVSPVTQELHLSQPPPDSNAWMHSRAYSPPMLSQRVSCPPLRFRHTQETGKAFNERKKGFGLLPTPDPSSAPLPPSLGSLNSSPDRPPDPSGVPLPPSLGSLQSSPDSKPSEESHTSPRQRLEQSLPLCCDESDAVVSNAEVDKMVESRSLDLNISPRRFARSESLPPDSSPSMLPVPLPPSTTPPLLPNSLSPKVHEPFLFSTKVSSHQPLSPCRAQVMPPSQTCVQVNFGSSAQVFSTSGFEQPRTVVSLPGVMHPVMEVYSMSPHSVFGAVGSIRPLRSQSVLPLSPPGLQQSQCLSPPGLQQSQLLSPPGFHQAQCLAPPGLQQSQPLSPPGLQQAPCISPPGLHQVQPLSSHVLQQSQSLSPPGSHQAQCLAPPGLQQSHPLPPPGLQQSHPLPPPGLQQSQPLSPLGLLHSQATRLGLQPLTTSQLAPRVFLSSQATQRSPPQAQNIPPPDFQGAEHKPMQSRSSQYLHPVYLQPVAPPGLHVQMQKSKRKSQSSRQSDQSGPRPHVEHTHRYTRPETFVNPPFGASLTQRPLQKSSSSQLRSSRHKRTHCPPPPMSYTSRYNQPAWSQGTFKSLPLLNQSRKQYVDPKTRYSDEMEESMLSRSEKSSEQNTKIDYSQPFCSLQRSLAYLRDDNLSSSQGFTKNRDVMNRNKGRSGRVAVQRSPHEEHGIRDQELLDYFVYMLRLLGGHAELNQLCGYYYRLFLERYSIPSIGIVLDPRFFTTQNSDMFSVCGRPGMFHVSLMDRGREKREKQDKNENSLGTRKNTSVWSQQSVEEEAKICKEATLPSNEGGIEDGSSLSCEKKVISQDIFELSLRERFEYGSCSVADSSPLTQNVPDPECTRDFADVATKYKTEKFPELSDILSKSKEHKAETFPEKSDIVSESKEQKAETFPEKSDIVSESKEQKAETLPEKSDIVSESKEQKAEEFPYQPVDRDSITSSGVEPVFLQRGEVGKPNTKVEDEQSTSIAPVPAPVCTSKHVTTVVSSELRKDVVHTDAAKDQLQSKGDFSHSDDELNSGDEYLIKGVAIGEGDDQFKFQKTTVGKETTPSFEADEAIAISELKGTDFTRSTGATKVTSESSIINSPNKPEEDVINSLELRDESEVKCHAKDDSGVKGYTNDDSIITSRCSNAASAVVTFSQGSSPNSSLPTPTSFDEDCWIENNPPSFSSQQPSFSNDWIEDNVPIYVTSQETSNETKSRPPSKGPQKKSSKRKTKEPPKPVPLKGKGGVAVVYSENTSRWERLDMPAEEISLESSETSHQVDEDKIRQIDEEKSEIVPSTEGVSNDHLDEPLVGSIAHFLSYTDRVLSEKDRIPFTAHCCDYRSMFKLSSRKYWYDVTDVNSDSNSFKIEKTNRVDFLVSKGSCSTALPDPPPRSKVNKSREREEKGGDQRSKRDGTPRWFPKRHGYRSRGNGMGRKHSRDLDD